MPFFSVKSYFSAMGLNGILIWGDFTPQSVLFQGVFNRQMSHVGFVFTTKSTGEEETWVSFVDDLTGFQHITLESFLTEYIQNPNATIYYRECLLEIPRFKMNCCLNHDRISPPLDMIVVNALQLKLQSSTLTNISYAQTVLRHYEFRDFPLAEISINEPLSELTTYPILEKYYFALRVLNFSPVNGSQLFIDACFGYSENFAKPIILDMPRGNENYIVNCGLSLNKIEATIKKMFLLFMDLILHSNSFAARIRDIIDEKDSETDFFNGIKGSFFNKINEMKNKIPKVDGEEKKQLAEEINVLSSTLSEFFL